MNRTAIKNFAVWARQQLVQVARQSALEYGIHDQMVEQTACGWFLELVTRRFLEVNGFPLSEAIKSEVSLPDLRLKQVVDKLNSEIDTAAFQGNVEIIGWMYQYYNSQRKDEVFAQLKKNIKITKDRIPVATQLFTPEWIVRYLVENSLGRIYIHAELGKEKKALSETDRIRAEQAIASGMGWRYYIPEAEQTAGNRYDDGIDITNIKIIDPCMGAGHILVYAFDVLMQIYRASGWSDEAAARFIPEHNLYGLDIDDSVSKLSRFAVKMKAGIYHPELFNDELKLNISAVQSSGFLTGELLSDVAGSDEKVMTELLLLQSVFQDAQEYGSLLNVPKRNFAALSGAINASDCSTAEKEKLCALVTQARIMAGEYDVVVTNPPYMGVGSMSPKLNRFVREHYPNSKSDLFAVFMERCAGMVKPNGYQAMITQHSWMFLRSFEKLRKQLLRRDLVNMAHLGPRAFAEIPGDVVQTVGFVLRNTHTPEYRGIYCRLTAPTTQSGKEKLFLSGADRYCTAQADFAKIPGSPVAYWLSHELTDVFASNQTVAAIAEAKQGIATANNAKYLRLWHECDPKQIFTACTSHELSAIDRRKWYPYNKGGGTRKWYGNYEYVINWHHDGQELRADEKAAIRNPDHFFHRAVSWSLICTGVPAFRSIPEGQLFDVAGMCCFSEEYHDYLLALFNSKVVFEMLTVLSPTINYQCGDIANIPVKLDQPRREAVELLAQSNVELCKQDWEAFEASRQFKTHPLV